MSARLERLLTVLLVASTAVVAMVLVHREFSPATKPKKPISKTEYISNWKRFLPTGRLVGDSSAAVKIIEFADLQCPYCRKFSEIVNATLQKHAGHVALVFIHFPLRGHPYALPAARTAECAQAENKFASVVNYVYQHQDTLEHLDSTGVTTWKWVAKGAGVSDTLGFARCMNQTETPEAIAAGIRLAKEIGVMATPTVIINGWRYGETPSAEEVERRIAKILAGDDGPRSLLSRLVGQ